jgi:hypothetical protein
VNFHKKYTENLYITFDREKTTSRDLFHQTKQTNRNDYISQNTDSSSRCYKITFCSELDARVLGLDA